MTKADTYFVFAILTAAFPRQEISKDTGDLYALFLADFEREPAERAVKRIITKSRFFPSIAELREEIAELALGLPSELEAWTLAERRAYWRPEFEPCEPCKGRGWLEQEGEPVCVQCHGDGRSITNTRTPLPTSVQRAFDYVGGAAGITEASEMGVIRAQFRDAYRQARAESVRSITSGEAPLPSLANGSRPQLDMGGSDGTQNRLPVVARGSA